MRTKSDKTATFQTRCSPEQKQALATYWESLSAGGSPSPQPMSQRPVKAKEQPSNPAPEPLINGHTISWYAEQWTLCESAWSGEIAAHERTKASLAAALKEIETLKSTGGSERASAYITSLVAERDSLKLQLLSRSSVAQ